MFSTMRTMATRLTITIFSFLVAADTYAQALHSESAAGFYTYAGGCLASSVTIQPDKKIVAAGWAGRPGEQQMIVVRFNQDRTLDTGFGEPNGKGRKGWKKIDFDGDARALDVEIDPKSGRILLAGWANSGGDFHLALVRLESDGDVDPTFQNSGMVIHRFESQTNDGTGFKTQTTYGAALAIDIHGNLIVAGRTGSSRDHEPFVSRFTNDGVHEWSRKHGTAGFDDGANAVTVQMKPEPYFIYTTGFSVITNVLRRFTHDGMVQVYQSSLGFGDRTWGISYDDSTDRLVTSAVLGRDMVIRLFDDRPEVLTDTKYPNPFKRENIDSVGRGFVHLSGGRFAVAGHGRPYDAEDNSGRRFHFALYETSGSLLAHDRPDFGGISAAAYGIAAHEDSLIALAGRVFARENSARSAEFKMGFVLYDRDGKRVGDPWTFEPVGEKD